MKDVPRSLLPTSPMYNAVPAFGRAFCTAYLPAGRVFPLTMKSKGISTTIRDNPCAPAIGAPQSSIAPHKIDTANNLMCCDLNILPLLNCLRIRAAQRRAFTRWSLYIRGQDRLCSSVRSHPFTVSLDTGLIVIVCIRDICFDRLGPYLLCCLPSRIAQWLRSLRRLSKHPSDMVMRLRISLDLSASSETWYDYRNAAQWTLVVFANQLWAADRVVSAIRPAPRMDVPVIRPLVSFDGRAIRRRQLCGHRAL